jgi:hypothetical protein
MQTTDTRGRLGIADVMLRIRKSQDCEPVPQ